MSEPLTDQIKQLNVTKETKRWLQMEAQITGQSQAEIARQVLHDHAVREMALIHDKHRMLLSMEKSEGDAKESPGTTVSSFRHLK